jgi:Uma2 family endonuclease
MQIISISDQSVPASLILDAEHPLTDDAYFEFCAANPDLNIERTPEGEIIMGTVSKRELQRFAHLVPEFVIEVMSPSDRLARAQKKMRLWAKNGVELGWLIDGDNRRVYVYRGTAEPRLVADAESIAGEGPVDGFILPLGVIWAGL